VEGIMKYLKICSDILLWGGRIFIIVLLGLIILLNFIAVPTNSWLSIFRTEIVGVSNILIIIAPFLLIIGQAIKKIYIELTKINNKLN